MAICKVRTGSAAFLFAMVLAAMTAGTVMAEEKQEPSGTVSFEEESMKVLVMGGEAGKGTLHFQGQDYPFKLTGISTLGVGFTKIDASGEVYGLEKVEDFGGNYIQGNTGIAVGEGVGGMWMHNDKGVTMHITTKTEGLELNIAGAAGVDVTMEE